MSLVRTINQADNAIADELATANLPIHHQLGIHFLTGGVGVTSPPAAFVVDDKPHCSSASVYFAPAHVDNSSSSLETTRYFDLPRSYFTLATSFLTNGVGATSPPFVTGISCCKSFRL